MATPTPDRMHVQMRLRLPDNGQGYTLEGEPEFSGDVAGYTVSRKAALAGDVLTIDETVGSRSAEIPVAQIPAERDRYSRAMSAAPRVLAPAGATRRWALGTSGKAAGTQLAAVTAVFANAVAGAEPEDTSALEGQASFLQGIGDYPGAVAAWTRVIAKAASAENYVRRGTLEKRIGNLAAAVKDAEAARALDPSNLEALSLVADITARRGDLAGAVKMFDDRLALAGQERDWLKLARAELIATYGNPQEAISLFDELIAGKPGRPELLSARCWTKASRQVQLDTALKDCTSAIELTDDTAPMLDSRALVWLRMGRLDSALNDLDAALLQTPSLGPSRLLRAIVLKKLGRLTEAQQDLTAARRLSPEAEADYRNFGLVY